MSPNRIAQAQRLEHVGGGAAVPVFDLRSVRRRRAPPVRHRNVQSRPISATTHLAFRLGLAGLARGHRGDMIAIECSKLSLLSFISETMSL